MKRKYLAIAALVVSLLCCACLGLTGRSGSEDAGKNSAEEPVVAAPTGTYIGVANDGVMEFKGIRYGEFTPFLPATDVTTTTEDQIEAKEWGYNCIQEYSEFERASQHPCSHDCLFLNIFTKDTTTKNKPVIFFIHGGGYIVGGESDPAYDPQYFVRNLPEGEDCVFVTINYRMNFMGGCDLSSLEGYTDEYAMAKDLSKLDQIQALKWVSENISAFGGDPENVTIMGQSSGASAVQTLYVDPDCNKYFNRCIQESGVLNAKIVSEEEFADRSKQILDILGVKSIDELTALTDEEIKSKIEEIDEKVYAGDRCADGVITSKTWWDDFRNGSAKDIDLMIGTTNGESDNASIDWETGETITDPSILIDMLSEEETAVPDVYGRYYVTRDGDLIDEYLSLGDDKVQLTQDLVNNLTQTYASYVIAEEQSKWNENTYLYYWEYAPDPEEVIEYIGENAQVSPWGRALHSMDLGYALGTKEGYPELTGDPAKMSDELIQKTQMAWYSFAKTGDPNNEYLDSEWKPFSEEDKNTMVITNEGQYICEKNYRESEMNVMSRLRPYGEK